MVRYIQDTEHYSEVIARMAKARRSLWIATADLKDLYVKTAAKDSIPFLEVLSRLVQRGVEVRLLHAKEPGQPFREDFDRYPALWGGMERHLCPRVHAKIVAIDSEWVYIGSANMTGAGMGMKSAQNRNFEAGILTDEPALIDARWRTTTPSSAARSVPVVAEKPFAPTASAGRANRTPLLSLHRSFVGFVG